MSLSRSFPPVVRSDCRLLVLGSLPGTASLAAGRYYAHPRNQFWHLMGDVLDADLAAQTYEVRVEMLIAAGIGLWDVVESAHRPGSLDSAIRNAEANKLAALAATLPRLRAVAFNGARSYVLGSRLLAETPLPLIQLPSSSPANARLSAADKVAHWLRLRPFIA
jgi:double-stranded uracil-DNA glycosylase